MAHFPRRRYTRLLALLVFAAVPALAATALAAGHGGRATTAPASGPSGVTIDPLVHATIPDPVRVKDDGNRIRTDGPRDVLGTSITVAPGGTFGWHTHPGPVLVAVASGTLTLFQPEHHGCTKTSVGAGQGFIEGGNDVHLARNDGAEPVHLFATFLAPTGTTDFLTTVPDPGTCNA